MRNHKFLRFLVAGLIVLTLARSASADTNLAFKFDVHTARQARGLKIGGIVTSVAGMLLLNAGAGWAATQNLGRGLGEHYNEKLDYTGAFTMLGVGAATLAIGVPLWIVGVKRLNRLGVKALPNGIAW